jgi:hypothetical protein
MDYIEEVRTPDGNFILKPLIEETQPDFLSGTTNKIKFYTQDSHYKNILEHFQNNLSASELLFVIGYGFQDEGINRILEDNYLRQGKKMVVINPNRIESHLLSNYSVTEIFKSVTDVTLHDYESLVHF